MVFSWSFVLQGKIKDTVWDYSGKIRKLYKTPLGNVFKFQLSDQAPWTYFSEKKIRYAFNGKVYAMEYELPDWSEREDYNYMVIELSVRLFPAVSKIKNPNVHIGFGISSKENFLAKTYEDLMWMDELHSGCTTSGYAFANCDRCHGRTITRIKSKPSIDYLTSGSETPYYEPEKYRFVFSRTISDGAISLYCTSCKKVKNAYRFVIFVPRPQDRSSTMDVENPRKYIELSNPTISFSKTHPDKPADDDKKTVLHSVLVTPMEYPYESYPIPEKKVSRLDNPDHQFACALKLQKHDPVQAQKMFEELGDSKSRHVFAMYKAGIGYWRGIGVKPDLRKAENNLKDAANYGLCKALAAYQVIHLENLPVERRIGRSPELRTIRKNLAVLSRPKFDTELSFIARLLRVQRYYRDIPEAKDAKNQLMEAIDLSGKIVLNAAKVYPEITECPAYYLAGGLMYNEVAEAMFKKGAKAGSIECELEVMRLRAEAGKLGESDFTEETDLKYADYPLYYILKSAVKNGKTGEMAKLFSRKLKMKPGPGEFDVTAAVLYDFYTRNFRNSKYLLLNGDSAKLDTLALAERKLDAAIINEDPVALYLLGLEYYRGIHAGLRTRGNNRTMQLYRAAALFRKAAEKGHLKARYMEILTELDRSSIAQSNWIDKLKELRKLNYGPAWRLTGEILEKRQGRTSKYRDQILGSYRRAAKLGDNSANRTLALFLYRGFKRRDYTKYKDGQLIISKDLDIIQAAKLWQKYIHNDCVKRCNNPFDYFSSYLKNDPVDKVE